MQTEKEEGAPLTGGPVDRSVRRHTPGPWSVNRTISVGNQSEGFHITGPRDGSLSPVCYGADTGYGEIDANARLIAAAPDLLAACDSLVRWCNANPPAGEALYCVQLARDAVTKARGKAMCDACEDGVPNLRAIWVEADKKAKDWRDAGEVNLLQQMNYAYEGLKSLGWRDAVYAPKDGMRFLCITAGSTGVFPCHWMNNDLMKEGGGFWSEAHGDLWPTKPLLWTPMPSNIK